MASGSDGDAERLLFKPTTPHFFKIILPQTLHDGKLISVSRTYYKGYDQVIPRRFVKNHGNDLLDSVVLKVPSGNRWQVELFRSNGDVFFQYGWQGFVKHYSLAPGHLLVFEYTSNSCFNVFLFDESATEIGYPMLVHGSKKMSKDKEGRGTDNEDLVILLDDSGSPFSRKRKRTDVANPSKVQTSVSVDGKESDQINLNKSRTLTDKCDMSSTKRKLYNVIERTWPLTKEEKAKALQRANASFKSKNPFFMVPVQPSHTFKHRYSKLAIPFRFLERYFQDKVGEVVLRVPGGGTWSVGFCVYDDVRSASFKSNWKGFSRDNNLKVGDVCIFELTGRTELVFEVTISREIEDDKCSSMPPDEKQLPEVGLTAGKECTNKPSYSKNHEGLAAANLFTSKNPFFKIVFCKSKRCNVCIPTEFMIKHVKETEKTAPIYLQTGKGQWLVNLCSYTYSRNAYICGGWLKFATDNAIKAGDVCIFELIQNYPLLLHVSVVKHVGRMMFKPTTPHFFKIILPQTLLEGKLVLPRKFVRVYGNDLLDSVLLKVPSGNEWRVELFKGDGDVLFGNGWQEFVKYYCVEFGNLLLFQYKSNSCFNVFLFDTSATEINYPISVNGSKKTSKVKEVRITDDADALVITSEDYKSPLGRNRKRTSAGSRDKSSKGRSYEVAERTWPLTRKERTKALQRAKASFKSETGSPFFMVVMQPSYIHTYRAARMRLPFKFAKQYFQDEEGKVVLQLLGGGTWIVSFSISYAVKYAAFKSEWKEFSRHNVLKVGDVCIFELIGGDEPALSVTICKASKYTKCSIPPPPGFGLALQNESNGMELPPTGCLDIKVRKERPMVVETPSMKYPDTPSCSKNRGDVSAADNFTSKNPFFKVVIRDISVKFVRIPNIFLKNHLKDIEAAPVTLQVAEGELWQLKLHNYPEKSWGYLGVGWKKFARDNVVDAGDVCVFELIQKNPLLLHVSIFKRAGQR